MYDLDELVDLGLITAMVGNSATREVLDIYTDMCMIFNEVNFDGHLDELELLFNKLDSQNISYTEVREAIHEIMMTASEVCLQRVGVEINPDTPLSYMVDILKNIVAFDATLEPDASLAYLEAAEEDIEAICTYLAFRTEHPIETWMEHVVSVNTSTIELMKSSLLKSSETLENAVELEEYDATTHLTGEDIELFKKKELLKEMDPSLVSVDFVDNAKGFSKLFDEVYRQVNALDQDDYIKEMVAVGAMSTDTDIPSMESKMREILDDIYSSPTDRINANNSLRNHLANFKQLLG